MNNCVEIYVTDRTGCYKKTFSISIEFIDDMEKMIPGVNPADFIYKEIRKMIVDVNNYQRDANVIEQ